MVTLFTTPDPLTEGHADFSVAVERAGKSGLVENAHVDLILTSASGHRRKIVLHASHAAATSKWLQAANFSFPAPGLWRIVIIIQQGHQTGQCSGEVQVEPSRSRAITWDVLPVPLAAMFFVLHQNRKRKYERKRRRTPG
jgi:hypothetical protein